MTAEIVSILRTQQNSQKKVKITCEIVVHEGLFYTYTEAGPLDVSKECYRAVLAQVIDASDFEGNYHPAFIKAELEDGTIINFE